MESYLDITDFPNTENNSYCKESMIFALIKGVLRRRLTQKDFDLHQSRTSKIAPRENSIVDTD